MPALYPSITLEYGQDKRCATMNVRESMHFERFSVFNGDIQIAGRQRRGDGVHLVFAHGWISSSRMWDEVIAALPVRMGVTAFDFRGCGESDRPLEGHDLAGYAGDLRAVVAAIAEPVFVVGHSMGARVAQYFASDAASNLAGLVLIAPGVASGTMSVPRHRELTERAFGSRRRIQAFQRGAMARELTASVFDRIVNDAIIAQREHWFGWYDVGRTGDFSERLQQISVPVHVLAGEMDPLIPVGRVQREIIEKISTANLHVINGAGHNLPVEAVHEISRHIEEAVTTI